MSNGEYRKTCSGCGKRGDQTFARIYPRPINDVWVWLCSSCWETPNNACTRRRATRHRIGQVKRRGAGSVAVGLLLAKGKQMSNLILSARESNKGISVICPHCKFGSRYSVSYIEDALNEKLRLTCCVCEEKFGLVVMPLDTIAQPNTALLARASGRV